MVSYHRGAVALFAGLLMSSGATSYLPEVVGRSGVALPVVGANDNRKPAGVLKHGVLTVNLVVQMARWYPEAADGPYADVPAFAEEGKAPSIPGPLIRVKEGTKIVVTIRNALVDSAINVTGLRARPMKPDTTSIKPGASRTFRFPAGIPGTYMYTAVAGHVNYDIREREQLSSAFVVDPVNGRTDDRIFVINIWGEPRDSTHYRNAVAINGKSWPYTERITANVGDSLRWRVVNGSRRVHPMHLHGFYFRVDSRGTLSGDTLFGARKTRMAVTEDMDPFSTMAMVFSPDRPGNWLFHCHLTFHVNAGARLDGAGGEHVHEADPMKHMAGLVVGIIVKDRPGHITSFKSDQKVRELHLFADERPRKGMTPLAMSYVLQRDGSVPAADSVEAPGAVIVLRRNEPTRITIVNRTHQGTAVHWHGVELLSYADGVAGWSGAGTNLAPMVAPKDSFVANLRLPRAGTFIYHTHLNDIEQVTSGMYGALIVLPEGQKFDPLFDHSYVAGWNGDNEHIVVNGDSVGRPMEMKFGQPHRLRFINIGPASRLWFAVRRDSTPVVWKPHAKDGADLPVARRVAGKSIVRLNVGETFDAMFNPVERGEYLITAGRPQTQMKWSQRIIVR